MTTHSNNKSSVPVSWSQLSIAVPIYEGAEELDVVGPLEMFHWMSLFEQLPTDRRPAGENNFAVDFISENEFSEYFDTEKSAKPNIFTVAPSMQTYRMNSGMKWTPEYTFENAPHADVIVVPGGIGARDIGAREAEGTIDYIRKVAEDAQNKYVVSVCTGAFLLGAAGLLDGKHCQVSSHNYERFAREVPNARLVKDPSLNFVQDGKLFTSNGPASGLATALRVIEVHCGTGHKNNLRELIEYKVAPAKGVVADNGTLSIIHV